MKLPSAQRLWAFGAVAAVLAPLASSPALVDLWVTMKYRPQVDFDPVQWASADVDDIAPTARQRMIRHLVLDLLPGKDRAQIAQLLGPSPTHAAMRRYSTADLNVREKDENGNWKPFPRTGVGHYYDRYDWDMLYYIGREQIFIYDHRGKEFSPDSDVLMIRLGADGCFSSWYIEGSERWPRVVGEQAMQTFRARR